jgi:hypothetical protein
MSQLAAPEQTGNRASKLDDPEQTRNRLEILNQFFRGMLLLNGGACVALLAFLQAIWESRPPGFVHLLVYGMACFLLGLVFTVVGQFARYEISRHLQFGRARKGTWWRRAYDWLVALSVLAFIGGAIIVLSGLYSAPPPPPPEFTGRQYHAREGDSGAGQGETSGGAKGEVLLQRWHPDRLPAGHSRRDAVDAAA